MNKPDNQKQDLNPIPADSPMAEIIIDENGIPETAKNTIDRRKATLKMAGAALGGFAAASLLQAKPIEEIPVEETDLYDVTADIVLEDEASNANDPQTFNPHNAPIAHGVNDSMGFDEAFAAARHETGAGGVFLYHGEYYTTFYAEELGDDGNPIVEYDTVAEHELPVNVYDESNAEQVENTQTPNLNAEGESYHTMAVDTNADGTVDAVIVDINEDGSADAVFSDMDGDGVLSATEVQYIHDPQSLPEVAQTADPSMMAVDTNADGTDDVLFIDANQDAYADAVGTDANQDQQIDETEVVMLDGSTGMGAAGDEVVYEGEVASDMPEDVSDAQLDAQVDDVANLDSNFDEYNDWA